MPVSIHVADGLVSCLLCVGACIIASSVLKLRKCHTLFYVWARHVLWALRLKSINYETISILICKLAARRKQSVISVALKTHLEIRLGICIYETSLLHRPDDYLVSHQAVPPTFYNKIAPMVALNTCHGTNRHFWHDILCSIWQISSHLIISSL